MRLIKTLCKEIECNIHEADDKIECAYRWKTTDANIAAWYKDMAQSHLTFNVKGHELVTMAINASKNSDEYKSHPEFYEGMMAMWQDKHAEILAHSARVKSMIDGYK